MRPRIERREAAYILKLLEKEQTSITAQELELKQKLGPLEQKVAKAIWYNKNYSIHAAQKECNYPQCVKDLAALQQTDRQLLTQIFIYKKLFAKYQAIATGKRKGRYSIQAQDIEAVIKEAEKTRGISVTKTPTLNEVTNEGAN